MLLDSDCLPVTLFEMEDLWTEAYLARFPAYTNTGIPQQHPLHQCSRFANDPQAHYTQKNVSSTRMGQGVLVVTEPHSELNAGLIVVFRSSRPALFNWHDWALRHRSHPGSLSDEEYRSTAAKLSKAFCDRIENFYYGPVLGMSWEMMKRPSGSSLGWQFPP